MLETVHLAAMGVWAGALGMTGAAAAIAFPTMRGLEPTLGVYSAYTEPHWRLAAGHVAARLFFVSDLVQLGCAGLAGATLAALVLGKRVPWPGRLAAARLLVMTLILALASYRMFILAPRMDSNLARYREAAAAGRMDDAATSQGAFSADHPTASNVLTGTFVLVMAGLVIGAWQATGGGSPAPASPTPSIPPTGRRGA